MHYTHVYNHQSFHNQAFLKRDELKNLLINMTDGKTQTFHDFIWSAKSKLSGKEYSYPCHCRWEWEGDKITKTSCYVDPAAIFAEVALYQEKNQ